MKTSSAKSKGRRLQKLMCAELLTIGEKYGLEADDLASRGMGQNGVDVILSPRAMKLFNLCVEAKNVEKLNVVGVFLKHYNAYDAKPKWKDALKILVHSRNYTDPMVTLKLDDFIKMLETCIKHANSV